MSSDAAVMTPPSGGVEDPAATVYAAGTLPWRRRRGALEVALVHRPRYDDWSWPKGKLDAGESYPAAAVRETREETGLLVRLGHPLPTATYLTRHGGQSHIKEVRYWAAEVVGDGGDLDHEVDEVTWLPVEDAGERLSYPRDRDQLTALVAAAEARELTTWPLALVRHAKALPRASWEAEDSLRPLEDRGRGQAEDLVPVLAAYGVERLLSSPSTRCTDTLRPYAEATGSPLRLKDGLSEEGHAQAPAKAARHLERLLERGAAAAVCSHGPVIPAIVSPLRHHVDATTPWGALTDALLADVARDGMAKGETLLLHVVGTGEGARVIAAERHDPRDRA